MVYILFLWKDTGFFIYFICGAWDWTLGPVHARQVFYRWATSPAPGSREDFELVVLAQPSECWDYRLCTTRSSLCVLIYNHYETITNLLPCVFCIFSWSWFQKGNIKHLGDNCFSYFMPIYLTSFQLFLLLRIFFYLFPGSYPLLLMIMLSSFKRTNLLLTVPHLYFLSFSVYPIFSVFHHRKLVLVSYISLIKLLNSEVLSR
jgi:hypothetical protein